MIRNFIYLLTVSLFIWGCGQKKGKNMEQELTMVVGTYTDSGSKGIYSFRFNQETGESMLLSDAEASNPSYLTITENNSGVMYVYAVSEHSDGREAVNAFTLDKHTGKFTYINKENAMGADPCFITGNGKNVVTTNYSGGSISVFPLGKDGMVLPASDVIKFEGSGPVTDRQEKSHLHCVQFSPDGKYLFATNLGTDQIYKFEVNQSADSQNKEKLLTMGTPAFVTIQAGSGPRHLTFSPNGKYAYLISELAGTVTVFRYKDGNLEEIQTIIADDRQAQGSGDIHMSPDGKFVYATNRLENDGIAIFSVNTADGTLERIGYQQTGVHPRNFIITPNGKYLLLASRDNNAIQVFERNQETGLLQDIKKDIRLSKPVCIQFAL